MSVPNANRIAAIREEIRSFPLESGVYCMYAGDDSIIYIGKAKQLRNRVSSYFVKSAPFKVALILNELHRISYLVTSNEYEALLLENNLIKKHQPKFNVTLKDGKSYPLLRITKEEYPRMFKTRHIVDDGSDYFGPYPKVEALNTYLELLWKTLPLRRCKRMRTRSSPCLYYHIGRCAAPCAGKITRDEYHARVHQIRSLLQGSTKQFEAMLKTRMRKAAEELHFEQAKELRDTLWAIQALTTEQRIQDFNITKRDYLAYVEDNGLGICVVLRMQDGQMHGAQQYVIQNTLDSVDDILAQCVMQHYEAKQDIPETLFLSKKVSTVALIHQWFLEHCKKSVLVEVPKNAQDARLVHMAINNAWHERRKVGVTIGSKEALHSLQTVLQLPRLPLRIEGFDIAHIGGRHTMGSMVVAENGSIDAKQHRLYRIRTLEAGHSDDVGAIQETVIRRYTRVKNEGLAMPDLIVIDGGKGQLNAAHKALEILDLTIPLVAIAKREELLFSMEFPKGLRLPAGHQALRIVQMLRDEAHRFATNARSRAQHKSIRANVLMTVPGIGAKRAEKILKEYKHLSAVLEVSSDILAKSLKISHALAVNLQESIKNHLKTSNTMK